ncbi:hypothetical protein HNR48_000106 [Pseudoteredinibacter isoporae]|uniref:Uncharacterized protein n=1 Tax=Pseudoteredinibacter isoporae TaxID=570281 RepID=A0A7X0MU26_9GAMM|nr:hypothetical protein [Pseudoteredinibacter isoporae]
MAFVAQFLRPSMHKAHSLNDPGAVLWLNSDMLLSPLMLIRSRGFFFSAPPKSPPPLKALYLKPQEICEYLHTKSFCDCGLSQSC